MKMKMTIVCHGRALLEPELHMNYLGYYLVRGYCMSPNLVAIHANTYCSHTCQLEAVAEVLPHPGLCNSHFFRSPDSDSTSAMASVV